MVEAQGPQGLPAAPFCPLLQMMGVNSSGGQLGRWTGAPGGPLPPRPQPLLGSILLINTGSGTGLWLLSWAGEEWWEGVQCTPDPVPPPSAAPFGPAASSHTFSLACPASICSFNCLIIFVQPPSSPGLESSLVPGTKDSESAGQSHSPHNPAATVPRPEKQQNAHPSCLFPPGSRPGPSVSQ